MDGIRAVIYDLDGTLYDKSRLAFRLIVRESLRLRIGMLGRERKARKALAGREFPDEKAFYDAFYALLSPNRNRAERWYRHYLNDMTAILRRHYRLRDGVLPELDAWARKGIPVAVLSDYGAVREKLTALGFPVGKAAVLLDAPAGGGLKPCPRAFLLIAERLGVPPEQCLVIGDRADTDGAGAAAAGMQFRLV